MDTQQLAESKMLNEDGAQLLPKFKELIQEEHSFL
jgi:hypothetical protein